LFIYTKLITKFLSCSTGTFNGFVPVFLPVDFFFYIDSVFFDPFPNRYPADTQNSAGLGLVAVALA
jgi:hypothetical protein